ncbi:MAG: ribonuclease, partial [Butyrivibrio sp.]|nr:ribonuclease [Butyrivibrio sp.]
MSSESDDASASATIAETSENASTAETAENATTASSESTDDDATPITEDGTYTSKDDVALYIHTYGKLPSNFLTKKDAQARGWESSKGNLQTVAPSMSIGGDRIGNREGLLPDKKGRQYYE